MFSDMMEQTICENELTHENAREKITKRQTRLLIAAAMGW